MLADKVVVVTGGAGVIGRQFCSAVAENGGIAVVADRNVEDATLVANAIGARKGARAISVALDITDPASVKALIATLQEKYGRIDAVVNCAYPRNKNYGRKLEDVTYRDFCENVEMHLGGYFLVTQQFCLAFKAQGGGTVVNMSSIYGTMTPRFKVYEGTPMTMPVEYAAIKSGVVQLSRYFAEYFKGTGIRVNCISPGGILSDQPKSFLESYNAHCASKGMLAPQDLQGALLFLLSDASRFMTGQNLMVDDGFSL